MSTDIKLQGHTDVVEEPEFSLKSFWDGTYQSQFSAWYDTSVKPRGVFTKTYATLNYNLFHQSQSVIVGEDDYLFLVNYINGELCLNGTDFSAVDKQTAMNDFVDRLSALRDKLKRNHKELYVYVAASKADICRDKLPSKYVDMEDRSSVNAVDLFEQYMSNTEIPHLICSSLKNELEYPAFYASSIHWSRTYEQIVSRKIIEDLCEITGGGYHNIILNGVNQSITPFWRDTDGWLLTNIFNKFDEVYYEYESEREYPQDYDKLRVFCYGDSFAQGLRKDVLECYPNEEIYLVNYDNYVIDSRDNVTYLNHSWDKLDWQFYLDNTDIVIIEMTEPFVMNYTLGFADYLSSYLDNYVPETSSREYMKTMDGTSEDEWCMDNLYGVYGKEDGYAWIKPECEIYIQNEDIISNGLELNYIVPSQVVENDTVDEIYIYVNGKQMFRKQYGQPESQQVIFAPEELPYADDGIYDIEIYASQSFVPFEHGDGMDKRELSLIVQYVGGVR